MLLTLDKQYTCSRSHFNIQSIFKHHNQYLISFKKIQITLQQFMKPEVSVTRVAFSRLREILELILCSRWSRERISSNYWAETAQSLLGLPGPDLSTPGLGSGYCSTRGHFLPFAGSLWHKGAYNRSFPCMEANYPLWGLWMPELVLYGIKELA